MSTDDEIDNRITDLIEKIQHRLPPDYDVEKALADAAARKREMLRNQVRADLPQWQLQGYPAAPGRRFVIAHSWQRQEIANDPIFRDRELIQIDPGVAFGSTHPTTLLCIDALERYWQGGRLLDVGTGTGVQAIAAALLQPDAQIDAFDISQDVVEHAQLHLDLNRLTDRIELRCATIDNYQTADYDLVMANLLPDIIKRLKLGLIGALKRGGILIISGFTTESASREFATFDWDITTSEAMSIKDLTAIFTELNLELIEAINIAGWAGLVIRKPDLSNK